jgi:hypothetical protein
VEPGIEIFLDRIRCRLVVSGMRTNDGKISVSNIHSCPLAGRAVLDPAGAGVAVPRPPGE